MTPEFNLIEKYFTRPTQKAVLGIGDDCALINVSDGCELAISADTLVEGTHFFPNADARSLGHKALAVNLSDLAAMGATARYVTLALTLPKIDDSWLRAFSDGFFALAEQHDVELIGGDTTRGPLSMTLTVFGEVPQGAALRRDGAKAGDDVWVSGTLGDAALALRHLQSKTTLPPDIFERVAARLHQPEPRLKLGVALRGIASAAIDISDGLIADLTHICERSALSAQIEWPQIPLSPALQSMDVGSRQSCALTGGDDYELCFTAPPSVREKIATISTTLALPLTRIGQLYAGRAYVTVIDDKGNPMSLSQIGFDHFA